MDEGTPVPTQPSDDEAGEPRDTSVVEAVWDDDDEYVVGVPPWPVDAACIARIAAPVILTQLLRVANYTILLVMVRSFTDAEFGGLVLGLTFTNILLLSPAVGISSLLDTLVTREFGFDSSSTMMGLHLRRALVACTAWCVGICVVLVVLSRPLMVAAYGKELGVPASQYLQLALLPALPMTLATAVQKFLTAQRIVDVPLYAQAVATASLPLFMLVGVSYGVPGVAIAAGCARLVTLVAIAWLGSRKPQAVVAFGAWSTAEVLDRGEMIAFVRQSLPSIATTCGERWSFESISVIAGTLGATVLDAWAILLNLWIVCFSACVGFYTASSTLVGNALGDGRPSTACRLSRRAFAMHAVSTGLLALAFALFPQTLLRAYPSSAVVHELASAAAPVVALAMFADTCSYVLQGSLRAARDLFFIACLTISAQWLCSVVLASILTAAWHSISALAIGIAFGGTVQMVGMSWRVHTLDWIAASSRRAAEKDARAKDDDLGTSVTTSVVQRPDTELDELSPS